MKLLQKWIGVSVFAVAMGYLEAAVVFYLRTMVGRMDPYQPDPLPRFAGLGMAELWREAATLVMIMAVGAIAGKTWRGKVGYAFFVFGIWDITYYIFLRPLTGWPTSLANWDILFLLPLPWWGPVWAPVSIALLMILFGILATLLEQAEPPLWPGKLAVSAALFGILIALLVFMADAIFNLKYGAETVRQTLPKQFQTTVFICAVLLMSTPVVQMGRQLVTRYK